MSHTCLFSDEEQGWFKRFDPQTIHAFLNTLNEIRVREGKLEFEDVQSIHDDYFPGSNKIGKDTLQKIYSELVNCPRCNADGSIADDILMDPPVKCDDCLMTDAGIDYEKHMLDQMGKEPKMYDEVTGPEDGDWPGKGHGMTLEGGFEDPGPREPGSDGPTS